MANQRNADGKMTFVRLSTLLIEVYSKQSDVSTQEEIPPASKPGGFVALKGKDQGREGHRAGKETKRAPEEDDIVCASERTMFLAIINLLSAKHEDKPRPVVHECFEYSKHGSCRFGERCRFHHQEDKYEASTSKKRRGEDNSNARMCLDFDRGKCTFGDNCRFSHDENIFRARYKDGDF